MKKLLALMLCICFCFLTFSCNKVEAPTETKPTEADQAETEPTETEPPDPEPIKLNINVVEDNKIVFPKKAIEYVKVTWDIGKLEDPSSILFTMYPGDEFIFRRPESISRIVSFFENLPLGTKKGVPYGRSEPLIIYFYFNDNTYLEFGSTYSYRIWVPTGTNDDIQNYECDMSGFREICGLVGSW